MTIVFIFILGLFIGSFLNLLIDRLPRGEQIVKGRSKCDSCKHTLYWYDLIPVFSWVYLKGKCRYCKKSIPVRNTSVELITGSLFVINHVTMKPCSNGLIAQVLNCSIAELILLVIISALIVIFFIDLKHLIIPDILTLIIGVSAVLLWFILPSSLSYSNYLLSALGAGAFFLLLVVVTKGKGMGFGDVKFSFVMGLLLGFPGIVISLYIAFLTGATLSAILVLRRKKRFGQVVPFGPFLVFGTLIALFNLIPYSVTYFLMPYLYL